MRPSHCLKLIMNGTPVTEQRTLKAVAVNKHNTESAPRGVVGAV